MLTQSLAHGTRFMRMAKCFENPNGIFADLGRWEVFAENKNDKMLKEIYDYFRKKTFE